MILCVFLMFVVISPFFISDFVILCLFFPHFRHICQRFINLIYLFKELAFCFIDLLHVLFCGKSLYYLDFSPWFYHISLVSFGFSLFLFVYEFEMQFPAMSPITYACHHSWDCRDGPPHQDCVLRSSLTNILSRLTLNSYLWLQGAGITDKHYHTLVKTLFLTCSIALPKTG
jgi:hypothetical protein